MEEWKFHSKYRQTGQRVNDFYQCLHLLELPYFLESIMQNQELKRHIVEMVQNEEISTGQMFKPLNNFLKTEDIKHLELEKSSTVRHPRGHQPVNRAQKLGFLLSKKIWVQKNCTIIKLTPIYSFMQPIDQKTKKSQKVTEMFFWKCCLTQMERQNSGRLYN